MATQFRLTKCFINISNTKLLPNVKACSITDFYWLIVTYRTGQKFPPQHLCVSSSWGPHMNGPSSSSDSFWHSGCGVAAVHDPVSAKVGLSDRWLHIWLLNMWRTEGFAAHSATARCQGHVAAKQARVVTPSAIMADSRREVNCGAVHYGPKSLKSCGLFTCCHELEDATCEQRPVGFELWLLGF